jgi:hypothetical protein
MSRSMNLAVLVCALGLASGHSAAAQGGQALYEDTCPAKWSDEIRQDTLVVKCRTAFRENFLKGLAAPPLPSGLREFTVDPIALITTDEHHRWLARQGVRIHVVNINPYLYQYKVSVKQTPIVETAPFDFFKALLPGIAISPAAVARQPRTDSTKSLPDSTLQVSTASIMPGKKVRLSSPVPKQARRRYRAPHCAQSPRFETTSMGWHRQRHRLRNCMERSPRIWRRPFRVIVRRGLIC